MTEEINDLSRSGKEEATGLEGVLNCTEDDTSYDRKAKEVLSYKVFLARILKVCAEEFRDVDEEDIIEDCIEGIEIEKELVDEHCLYRHGLCKDPEGLLDLDPSEPG